MADATQQTFKSQFPWDRGDVLLVQLRSLMTVLDNTLVPLLASKVEYDRATTETKNLILQRFAEQIQPIFDSITSAASLGALFATTSVSTVTVGLGLKSFTIDAADRLQFATAAYVGIVSQSHPASAMLGPVVHFDRTTGILTIECESASGINDIRSDWNIAPAPPPYVPVGFNAGRYATDGASDATPFVSMPNGASGGISGGTY